MSKASFSVMAFGIYLILVGMGFLVMPNSLLPVFQLPTTSEVWIRIMGMLAMLIGYYYVSTARKEMIDFHYFTVYARIIAFTIFLILVLTKLAYPILILFGIIDLLGAGWTFLALKK